MYANTDVYNHPLFRSFKNTQDKEPSSNTDEVIKIIVASNFITEAARRPAVSKTLTRIWEFSGKTVMTIIVFCTCCYNCSQCTNHGCKLLRTTFQMWLMIGPIATGLQLLSFQMTWIDVPWGSLWFIGRVIYYYYYSFSETPYYCD